MQKLELLDQISAYFKIEAIAKFNYLCRRRSLKDKQRSAEGFNDNSLELRVLLFFKKLMKLNQFPLGVIVMQVSASSH